MTDAGGFPVRLAHPARFMTENARPEPASVPEWMVGCSPSRTLLARRLDDERAVLVKIYETGSPAEAARELELGRRLAGPGVAAHLEAGVDTETGKPCLIQELAPGQDLETRLIERGALPAREAASIARGIAEVLVRFAEHRDSSAPAGFVHGDVKPANVVVDGEAEPSSVVLLDLEHAGEAPTREGTRTPEFTGGTHGFAPPEAYQGARPTPAFDVFGLGAVLHVMLSGAVPFGAPGDDMERIARAVTERRRRRWLLDGCPDALRAIVEACLHASPRARPTARAVLHELDAWLARAGNDEEPRLLALAGRPLSALAAMGPAARPVERARLARRGRLIDTVTLPRAPDEDAPIDRVARELEPSIRAIDTFLLRFPLHPTCRAARQATRVAAARLAVELPERVAALKRVARFDEARALCDGAAAALALAGRLPRPVNAQGTRPTLAERDPLRVIAMIRRDVDAAADAHEVVAERIRRAEAEADPAGVEAAIGELAEIYGGASVVVAAAKDRLARFDFYLARIGQQAALVDELDPLLQELGVEADLSPVEAFRRTDAGRAATRPRALLRALSDLTAEFPTLSERVAPAREALGHALETATAKAWEIADGAEEKLHTPPIPIRPLTTMLARLDRMLQLDVLVDVPDRPRSELHDHIESLRTKIEQARAERDRITRGAQEAMDRGHLTTAIYDMARAVDRFATEGGEGPGLADQFAEAKRRKQEIEEALERNHQLAARYGELVGDPTSLPAERLAVLHEREHLLSFLCSNLGHDRAAAYAEDLRVVQLDALREQSAEGERRLAAARGSEEKLAIAQRTFDALQHAAPEAGWNPHEAREARELIQHWIDVLESAAQDARSSTRARVDVERRKRRSVLTVAVVAIAVAIGAVAIGFGLQGKPDDPVAALQETLGEPGFVGKRNGAATSFDAALEIARMRDFVAELGGVATTEVIDAAEACVARVDDVDRGTAKFPVVAEAVERLRGAADGLEDTRVAAVVGTFGQRALRAGFVAAVLRDPSDDELARRLEADQRLRSGLSLEDADALAEALRR